MSVPSIQPAIPDLDRRAILSGKVEAAALPANLDQRSVPDFAYNALYRRGLLYRPVFDVGSQNPVWPGNHPFAVCLTHDVDVVTEASARQALRRLRSLRRGTPALRRDEVWLQSAMALRRLIQSAVRFNRRDPLWCFEKWIDAEQAVGARSTFFFFPDQIGRPHHSDCNYAYRDAIVFRNQRMSIAHFLREVARAGNEIGLHASWNSFDDATELAAQRQRIETLAGNEVVSVRHHWLHYDIRLYPGKTHAAAGLRYDSSLGFNDNVGFRFGTCRPWYLTDLKTDTELAVLEIPLLAQDSAMLNPSKGLRLDTDTAFTYLVELLDEVQAVGGVFNLSFHPDSVRADGWFTLYERILRELAARRPWFATIREVGEHWTKSNPQAAG